MIKNFLERNYWSPDTKKEIFEKLNSARDDESDELLNSEIFRLMHRTIKLKRVPSLKLDDVVSGYSPNLSRSSSFRRLTPKARSFAESAVEEGRKFTRSDSMRSISTTTPRTPSSFGDYDSPPKTPSPGEEKPISSKKGYLADFFSNSVRFFGKKKTANNTNNTNDDGERERERERFR